MVAATTGPTSPFELGLGPITCHAWNKDRSRVAVGGWGSEIRILKRGQSSWETEAILAEHDLPVTGLDWAPESDRIVSCSQDKNAFVWTREDGSGTEWKPELVLVRLNRAATCVAWSPSEKKFAVGSGSKLVAVCYYDAANSWWIAKHIKGKIRSTVTAIHWHPQGILLAVGSCDFKTRVFSAYIKEVDQKPAPTPWGVKMPLGQLMTEFSNGGGGWVHAVRFSPSGNRLAWTGHDSSLSVVEATDPDKFVLLNFCSLFGIAEDRLADLPVLR